MSRSDVCRGQIWQRILTISKDRLMTLWGSLSTRDLDRVEQAVKTVLAPA